MTSITYHLATAEEVPEFHKFFAYTIRELFCEYSKETLEYFVTKDYDEWWMTKSIKEKSKYLYIAKDGSKTVGYNFFGKVYGGVTMSSWIAVIPEYQNQGIAKKLLSLWEDWALNNGAHAIQIWTRDKNIAYYEKRGFTYSGKFPNAWFGMTTNLLYKTLIVVDPKSYQPLNRS